MIDPEVIEYRAQTCGLPEITRKTRRFSTWVERKGAQVAFVAARKFASGSSPYPLLTIVGEPGTGKSHLAAAIGWDWLEAGRTVIFRQVEALLDQLRRCFELPPQVAWELKEPTFEMIMGRLRAVDLLILDDLGTEKVTEWARAKLDLILDHRWINELPLVATTNVAAKNLPDRIADRLSDWRIGKIVAIDCPSFRIAGRDLSRKFSDTLTEP